MILRLVLFLVIVPRLALGVSSVSFAAKGTKLGVTIQGMCSHSSVITQTRHCRDAKPCNWIHAEVEIESCTTNNSLRDQHMKKALKVSSSPKATLCAFIPMTTGPFKGELSVSGTKSNVDGTANWENKKLTLAFTTTLQNHGIEPPSFLGVTVANEVQIEAVWEK